MEKLCLFEWGPNLQAPKGT